MQEQTAALIKIAQRLPHGEALDYDHIELPFELVKIALKLWENIYPPELLENLANSDPDTLVAWAIALSQTLSQQLSLLDTWKPHFSARSIPPKLAEKLENNYQKLAEISRQTSGLLATANQLFSQENQLKQAAAELARLKSLETQLNHIETELKNTDLDQLRQDIERRSQTLKPQYQELETLQQRQDQLAAQQTRLEAELQRLRSRQNQREDQTAQIATELITLTQTERHKLNPILSEILAQLQQEKAEFDRLQSELKTAIADCNRYQQETTTIGDHLSQHYDRDRQLCQYLPVNHGEIDPILEQIKTLLQDLDRQLTTLQKHHAEEHQKLTLNFSS